MPRDDLTGHLLKHRQKARSAAPAPSDGRPRLKFDAFTWFTGFLLALAIGSQFVLMLWFE